jgi:hypothetical protein
MSMCRAARRSDQPTTPLQAAIVGGREVMLEHVRAPRAYSKEAMNLRQRKLRTFEKPRLALFVKWPELGPLVPQQ